MADSPDTICPKRGCRKEMILLAVSFDENGRKSREFGCPRCHTRETIKVRQDDQNKETSRG